MYIYSNKLFIYIFSAWSPPVFFREGGQKTCLRGGGLEIVLINLYLNNVKRFLIIRPGLFIIPISICSDSIKRFGNWKIFIIYVKFDCIMIAEMRRNALWYVNTYISDEPAALV
jgi:hypothetical protein